MFVVVMEVIVRHIFNYFYRFLDLMLDYLFFFDHERLMMMMNTFDLGVHVFVIVLFDRNVNYYFLFSVISEREIGKKY